MTAAFAGQLLLRRELAQWRSWRSAVLEGTEPEALHQLRVSGRRLIGVLRVLEAAALPGALALRRRMKSLVSACGAARDLDVRLGEIEVLSRDAATRDVAPLLARLARQRERAQRRLRRTLTAPGAERLLVRLDALACAPLTRRVSRPLVVVAEELLGQCQRRMRRSLRRVGQESTAQHCHELRLATKRLRYLCEPLEPLYGVPLRRYLTRLQQLQTLLGRINDAHHAIGTLESEARHAGRGLPAAVGFAMGRAAGQHQAQLLAARDRLAPACRRVDGRRWRRLRAHLRAMSRAAQSGGDAGAG